MAEHVVTIGGGFSGTMLAVNLLRLGHGRVTLIERGHQAGRGLAYGAAHPSHLLNVRAGNMSALHDQPDHLVRWLEEQGQTDAAPSFVSRQLYGDYLRDLLRQAEAEAGDRLEVVCGEAADVEVDGGGFLISLADGRRFAADAAALALGNAPPQPPRSFRSQDLPPGAYVGDPWQPDIAAGLRPQDTVLIIGTGLTMVDVALLLQEEGFAGSMLAVSRRGLLPRAHAAGPPPVPQADVPDPVASQLVRNVRRRSDLVGWRAAVDELRPVTQALWDRADPAARRRFLRHLRPWWDVHRHRIAPQIAGRIEAMIQSGQLRVVAGKLTQVTAASDGAMASFRPRGQQAIERVPVARIINCTGPEANLRATADPLLHRLLERGLIRPDPLGIGVDVDRQSRIIGGDGEAHPNLFALGPLTRDAFWEIIAVPDIRRQVLDVARHLSGNS